MSTPLESVSATSTSTRLGLFAQALIGVSVRDFDQYGAWPLRASAHRGQCPRLLTSTRLGLFAQALIGVSVRDFDQFGFGLFAHALIGRCPARWPHMRTRAPRPAVHAHHFDLDHV